ncbi:MAG: methyltransferase regulatory domain-containing protein [Alphaproteobacteria bacterium]|nr:methyltransferase regulatory domain-containing protein [Alphaproteobacteria bacterium]
MTPCSVSSPVSLSYVGALRGITPRKPGTPFAYALAACRQPYALMCLAASNSEGRFFGLMSDAAACTAATEQARARMVDNVTFLAVTPEAAVAQILQGASPLPPLNYLVADESSAPMPASERAALFDMAAKLLLPGGLFHYSYAAYNDADGALRFLVREFAPEMSADQAKEFLHELKALGGVYFSENPAVAAKLDHAIAQNMPDAFFADYDAGEARSAAFDTIVALRPRDFAYAGDGSIAANYIELSVPPEAHPVIVSCRDNPLYEPIKDFALNRRVRSDIWCRQPAPQTSDIAELFGGFAYGIVLPEGRVPTGIKARGAVIDLSSPLFAKLTSLMTLTPATIGDFLAHPDGQGFAPMEVVGAVQILVACGLAQPMRGLYQGAGMSNLEQPKLSGSFNLYLDKTDVTGEDVWLASPVLGGAIILSPRDALVMQALNRAGLANSVAALLPELGRLAQNPSRAARVMDTAEPTPETAHNMIEDAVGRSIIQWYAYGLLEAA